MKQRLAIAIALLGDPEFLMLDEPMNGLDPTGVREMRELILKLNKEKKITILISSHILGELSKIATYYGVINNGKLIDEFTLQELKEKCAKSLEISVDDAERAVEILRTNLGIFGDELIVLDSNTIRITKNLHRAALVNTELARNGVSILSSQMINHDMEDFFLKLIMKS